MQALFCDDLVEKTLAAHIGVVIEDVLAQDVPDRSWTDQLRASVEPVVKNPIHRGRAGLNGCGRSPGPDVVQCRINRISTLLIDAKSGLERIEPFRPRQMCRTDTLVMVTDHPQQLRGDQHLLDGLIRKPGRISRSAKPTALGTGGRLFNCVGTASIFRSIADICDIRMMSFDKPCVMAGTDRE